MGTAQGEQCCDQLAVRGLRAPKGAPECSSWMAEPALSCKWELARHRVDTGRCSGESSISSGLSEGPVDRKAPEQSRGWHRKDFKCSPEHLRLGVEVWEFRSDLRVWKVAGPTRLRVECC